MPKVHYAAPRSRYVTSTLAGEKVRAFVPPRLPPNPRAIDLASLQAILAKANQAIGRLDGTTSSLPDLKLFLYSYVRKEAVLSSQIEGIRSRSKEIEYLIQFDNVSPYGGPPYIASHVLRVGGSWRSQYSPRLYSTSLVSGEKSRELT